MKYEHLQDKSVLYNEVLDVIRALYTKSFTNKEEKYPTYTTNGREQTGEFGDSNKKENIFDPLVYDYSEDELIDKNDEIVLNIEADLIKEAWMRFRPKTGRKRNATNAQNNSSPDKSSLSIHSDISQAHQANIHNFSKALSNKERRKTYLERYPLDEVEQNILEEEK